MSATCRKTWRCSTAPLPRTSPASRSRPTVGAIIAAAKAADVHERSILRLPEGYETRLGPGGLAMSAGQRQRIALARALYRDPFLIVLDEPNSNLDAEGESRAHPGIVGVRNRGGIAIVIAHRPSALAAVDMVGVMGVGQLTAFGPKDEVLKKVLKKPSIERVMSSGEPVAKVAAFPQPAAPVEPMLPAGSDFGLRRRLIAGLIVAGFLVFGVGSWAAVAALSGAVIASGLIVVDSNSKKVQHPSGGVVGEILVKNGDAVAANDILLRLDDTQTRAALGIVVSQLVELTGRKARLMAERDDAPEIEFPADFASIAPDASRVAAGERRLFEARRKTTAGQKAQHRERIEQLRHEVTGLSSQRDAKARELGLVREELARLTDMYRRNLLPVTRVLAMQSEEARIDGEHGALVAQIARASGQIGEIELQILSIDQTLQSDAQKELREIEGRIAELSERRVAAEDQLKRIDLAGAHRRHVCMSSASTPSAVSSPKAKR